MSLFFIHPPNDPKKPVSNYTKDIHENKTDGNNVTNVLKNDEIEKLEELNNLNINVMEWMNPKH